MSVFANARESGTVYLVGAGPGDPGLLTRHGADALMTADVVVYDRLADNSMLSLAPPDAELVYVGKQAAVHAVPQIEINRILRDRALEGKCVVRLKGGDPFVFGRGGEEASFLREHGIRFIVVPGVSSAVAAPAYAGIPVTDRRCASSFAVITGHEDPSRPESRLDWAGIANGADTLIFVMGLTNLPQIAERLISEGRPADTPVAVIERGTTPGQRVVTGRLDDIAERARTASLHPPALLVVGEVVRFHETLAWHDSGPLAGKRILMPRVRRRPSELARLLRVAGGEVTEVPVLRVQAHAPAPDLLERLRAANWVLFTSPGGLDALLEQLGCAGEDVRRLAGLRLAAMGEATRAHLKRRHLQVDHVCTAWPRALSNSGHRVRAQSSSLVADWPLASADRVLIVGETDEVERALVVLSGDESLNMRGVILDVLPSASCVTDTRAPLPPIAEFDAIVLASSGAVRCFSSLYAEKPELRQWVASMGPATSTEARSLGIRVDAEAEEPTAGAAARLLIQRLSS